MELTRPWKVGKKGKKKKKAWLRHEKIHVADLFLEDITKNVIKSPKVWELWMAMLLSQKQDFWMQLETIAVAACEPRNKVCLGSSSSSYPAAVGRLLVFQPFPFWVLQNCRIV